MILERLRGRLAVKNDQYVIIESEPFSFGVHTSRHSSSQLGEPGTMVELVTHLQVREDALDLYGFTTREEREVFQDIISVNRFGPKDALNILSLNSPSLFKAAIIQGNLASLTAASGIGRKKAEVLLVQLKDNYKLDSLIEQSQQKGGRVVSVNSSFEDALKGLLALGYNRNEAQNALRKAGDNDVPAKDLVREALKLLRSR